MNQTKRLNIIDLVCNIVVVVMVGLGFYFMSASKGFGAESLKFYTNLTALVTALGAFLMIWSNIVSIRKERDCTPRLFFSIRFLSAVMSVVTLLTVIIVLRPQDTKRDVLLDVEGGFLFLHLLGPAFSIAQFIFFEIQPKARFKKTFEPFIATLIYGFAIIVAVLVVNSVSGPEVAAKFAPYPFFRITPEMAGDTPVWQNVLYLLGLMIGTYILSVVIWGINRIISAIFVGVEVKSVPEKKGEQKPQARGFKAYLAHSVSFNETPATQLDHIYHISYHDRKAKTWKVKSENAGRALKVFKTQKEAIDYANAQVKLHGGSIRVHSMGGKIRKE